MSTLFDAFLGNQEEGALPEGSAVFANTGFIGPLMANRYWQFWSPEDIKLYDTAYVEGRDYRRRGRTNSYFYYFVDKKSGEDAAELLEAYKPRRVWHFEMPVASILNARSNLEKFGDSVTVDCRMTTLASNVYRHEFHLIALPSLVDALARAAGFIPQRIWHLDEVLLGIADEDFDDELQYKLIGDPQAKKKDAEKMAAILGAVSGDLNLAQNIALGKAGITPPESVKLFYGETKIHYTYSKLFTRRAKLWAALGEINPMAYIPTGQAATDTGKDFETSAPQLIQCLGVSTRAWTQPLFGRFHMAKDVRVDATYSEGSKRLSLPMVSEVFMSEKHASEVALAEVGTATTSSTSPPAATPIPAAPPMSVSTTPGEPAYPEAWVTYQDQWKEVVRKEKEKTQGVLPPDPMLVAMSGQISATPAEIKAWWNLV